MFVKLTNPTTGRPLSGAEKRKLRYVASPMCVQTPVARGRMRQVKAEILIIPEVKPDRWPWNKKLICCGQIEKVCGCGMQRRYG